MNELIVDFEPKRNKRQVAIKCDLCGEKIFEGWEKEWEAWSENRLFDGGKMAVTYFGGADAFETIVCAKCLRHMWRGKKFERK